METPHSPTTDEIELKTWVELIAWLRAGTPGVIWRGQRCYSWSLRTSLERATAGRSSYEVEQAEQQSISWFRAHAWTRLTNPPDDKDLLSWLVTMQHYGAPTRLLDWAESPFVAAYFAYSEMLPEQNDPAALWALQSTACRQAVGKLEPTPRDDFHRQTVTTYGEGGYDPNKPGGNVVEHRIPAEEEPWDSRENRLIRTAIKHKVRMPLPVVPAHPDARMTAQQTVLTVQPNLEHGIPFPLTYEAAMMSGSSVEPGPHGASLLQKIKLPSAWRPEVLETLRVMGITDANLFPGLDGIGRQTTRMLRESWFTVRTSLEAM